MAETSTRYLLLVCLMMQGSISFSSNSDYKYPLQSLICKTHDVTNMDCSNRNLEAIPPMLNQHNMTSTLDLSSNNLTEIAGTPFVKLSNLQRLDLSHNAISTMSDTVFKELQRLHELDLSFNRIVSLPTDIFQDLSQLRYLYMYDTVGESPAILPNQAFAPLYSLQRLVIAGRNYDSLQVGQYFQNLQHLNELHLTTENPLSNITNETLIHLSGLPLLHVYIWWAWDMYEGYVETGAFAPLTRVQNLTLTWDALVTLESVHSPLERLEILTSFRVSQVIDKRTFQILDKWNSSLHFLSLQLVFLKRIEDDTFIWTSQLTTLDLSENMIDMLAANAFNGLNILEKLILSGNNLNAIPVHSFGVFRTSGSLRSLDIGFNSINDFIASDAFTSVSSVTYLNLRGNKIAFTVDWINTCDNLTKIIMDSNQGHAGAHVDIESPLLSLKSFHFSDVDSIQFGTPMCTMFPNLEHVIISSAPIDDFPSALSLEQCLYLKTLHLSGSINNIKVSKLPTQLSHLRTLNMAGNKISAFKEILFIKAPMLKTLDLSFNDIQTINSEVLASFPNLVTLNLDVNKLVSIDGLQYLTLLKNLNLAGNQLTIVPTWLLSQTEDSALETLDLSQNPFICNCDIKPFTTWILSNTVTWLLSGQYTCASPKNLEGQSITSFELDCRSRIGLYLGVSLPLIPIICICIVLLFQYRWHIRYRFFLLYRNLQPFPNNDEDFEMVEVGGNLEYHAYVAYDENCQHDEDWVMDVLRPNMEDIPEPLRLCIKGRDFIPGRSIVETISESIQRSRKTILVLTPHFVESEWCYYEMQMAQMRLFHENQDVLILILLEDIQNNQLTMSLRQLLCRKEYLQWPKENRIGQRLFWQKLKDELHAPVRVDRRFDV